MYKPKSWHIWDFPDNIYVFLKEEIHKEFFNTMFKKFNGKRPYARFLGISQMQMKQYWRRYSKKNQKRYVQYIPVWVLKKSCNTKRIKRKIERNIEEVRVRAGIPIHNLKLPIKESPSLYRIVAHLIGDGYAGKLKVPYYCNTCKELREQFKRDLQIFGKINTYERTPNTTPCIMFPKPIADIIRYLFKIEFVRPSKLPKEIFNASEECKSVFLQALFDDEGTISTCLALSMTNQNLVNEIKRLIESLGIETNGPYKKSKENCFTLQIKPKYIFMYQRKIGFTHPQKVKNLEFAIKTKERNKTQRTRPLEETRENILRILKNKPLPTIELANSLSFTIAGLYHHLKVLEKDNKIKKEGYKNKAIWKLS